MFEAMVIWLEAGISYLGIIYAFHGLWIENLFQKMLHFFCVIRSFYSSKSTNNMTNIIEFNQIVKFFEYGHKTFGKVFNQKSQKIVESVFAKLFIGYLVLKNDFEIVMDKNVLNLETFFEIEFVLIYLKVFNDIKMVIYESKYHGIPLIGRIYHPPWLKHDKRYFTIFFQFLYQIKADNGF